MASLAARLDRIEPLILAQAGKLENSVYGIVDHVKNGKPHCVRKWEGTIGNMVPSRKKPTIYIAEKLEPVILKHKKYKLLYGGRAGTKSIAAMDIMVGEVASNASGVFCLREQMKSLSQSIYKGIIGRVNELNFAGFTPVESKWRINHKTGGIFSFGGLRNVEEMKSLFQYKFFLLEEAANTSQEAIDVLGPTLRGVDGAELWYLWNPKSINDPMSKEFIVPYQEHLDRDGYYEDDYHLIIKVGFEDNPWFQSDSALRTEYEKDKAKKESGLMSAARFNHIWHGSFNDDIENGLIDPDWFDSCIDAHEKLGIEPRGPIIVSHDPADVGDDSKAMMARQGIVFFDGEEIEAATANDAFDIACGKAIAMGASKFLWDCDGLGAVLRNQASTNFNESNIETVMFKGSEGVEFPEKLFSNADLYGLRKDAKNKDIFRNKRAQFYTELAERCRKTYEAITQGKYYDPLELVSFSSKMDILPKLRAELCRMPLKPSRHGMIELYSKDEMRKGIMLPDGSRQKIPSPNLGDCAMMSFAAPAYTRKVTPTTAPTAMKRFNRR